MVQVLSYPPNLLKNSREWKQAFHALVNEVDNQIVPHWIGNAQLSG